MIHATDGDLPMVVFSAKVYNFFALYEGLGDYKVAREAN